MAGSLKSTPNDRLLTSFSLKFFILKVFAKNLLRGSRLRNNFIFLFWCLTRGLNSVLMSNKRTHYLLDYGNFLFSYAYWYSLELIYSKLISYLTNRDFPGIDHKLANANQFRCEGYERKGSNCRLIVRNDRNASGWRFLK